MSRSNSCAPHSILPGSVTETNSMASADSNVSSVQSKLRGSPKQILTRSLLMKTQSLLHSTVVRYWMTSPGSEHDSIPDSAPYSDLQYGNHFSHHKSAGMESSRSGRRLSV